MKPVYYLLLVMIAGACAEGAWKWGDSTDSPSPAALPTSAGKR